MEKLRTECDARGAAPKRCGVVAGAIDAADLEARYSAFATVE